MNEETLFQEALSRSAEQRAAFLEQACAGRPELLAAVEALLAAHEKSSNILDNPPVELGETVDQITARGYGLVTISYDSVEILDIFTQRRSIGYVMLSDPNSEVIDALGLREPRYELGHRAYGVPKPIIFVLDTEGIVQAKLYEEDYRARPPGSLIVETLDEVSD